MEKLKRILYWNGTARIYKITERLAFIDANFKKKGMFDIAKFEHSVFFQDSKKVSLRKKRIDCHKR